MIPGSIKIRQAKGSINIRLTGQAAHLLATELAAKTWQLMERRQVVVTFVDEGQDMLRWVISPDGVVLDCQPFHANVYAGAKVQRIPVPGDNIAFVMPGKRRMETGLQIESVEVML